MRRQAHQVAGQLLRLAQEQCRGRWIGGEVARSGARAEKALALRVDLIYSGFQVAKREAALLVALRVVGGVNVAGRRARPSRLAGREEAQTQRRSPDGSVRDLIDHLAFDGARGGRLPEKRWTPCQQASKYKSGSHFDFLRRCFIREASLRTSPGSFPPG